MILGSIFTTIYEAISGVNPDYSYEYQSAVFTPVGIASIFITFFFLILYYVVINRWRAGWHKPKHWALFLGINMAILMGLSIGLAKKGTGLMSADTYMIIFGIINAGIFTLLFFLLSLLFRNFSKHARHTPF